MIKVNELTDKIKTILNGNEIASAMNMKIYFCISVLYTIMWIVFLYIPNILSYGDSYMIGVRISKDEVIFLLFLYLPEIIILILNYLIHKMHFTNKTVIKIIRILISIFFFIYFLILFLLLIFYIYITLMFFDFGNSEY